MVLTVCIVMIGPFLLVGKEGSFDPSSPGWLLTLENVHIENVLHVLVPLVQDLSDGHSAES